MLSTGSDQPDNILQHPLQNPKAARFSPYEDNGGTTMAVAGNNFCVVAADTRMSQGYSIHTRKYTKIIKLTNKCVMATSGMQSDTLTLQKVLISRIQWYEHQHGRTPSTPSLAQLLSNTLYYRRFFPYYTFNVLCGIDDNGVGCCFSYDAVGSFERVPYSSSGSGVQLVQPFLDNQIGWKNKTKKTFESQDDVVALLKDALTSAGERDIYTGDSGDICIIEASGIRWDKFPIRED